MRKNDCASRSTQPSEGLDGVGSDGDDDDDSGGGGDSLGLQRSEVVWERPPRIGRRR